VVKPKGDVKSGYRFAFEAYKAQADLGNFNGVTTADAHLKFVGTDATSRDYLDEDAKIFEDVDTAIRNNSSRFYGMSRDEVFAAQYLPRKNEAEPLGTPMLGTALRSNLNTYLGSPTGAFVFNGANTSAAPRETAGPDIYWPASYGIDPQDIGPAAPPKPEYSGRFHVYNAAMVWAYENKYSKYHGWSSSRGQINKDDAGNDPKVHPIPVYYNFEDCFNEMYGVFNSANPKPDNDLSKRGGLTLSTTHDRFRVHSTQSESPFLRELNHRTVGGGWASGNDWEEYCKVPERHIVGEPAAFNQMISAAVEKGDRAAASWHELWMNTDDARDRGISDGMLVRATNPIGSVRVIARVTDRCMRGHVNLHQGGWYDPNPIDGVDDGGCANTLMSSKPSRYDHGNAQQTAYVIVAPETNYTFKN
jgi:anaerobic selenocysteine-containing dehydrogenase